MSIYLGYSVKKNPPIRKTSTLSTDADSRTDTNLKRKRDLSLKKKIKKIRHCGVYLMHKFLRNMTHKLSRKLANKFAKKKCEGRLKGVKSWFEGGAVKHASTTSLLELPFGILQKLLTNIYVMLVQSIVRIAII